MRIISLLPSATEIVCALGLEDALVGVTHECDYPEAARAKPAVTASALDHTALDAATIDRLVSNSVHDHRGIYTLDEALLEGLAPDLILTQELCDVCAVSYSTVMNAARILPGDIPVVSLEPSSLDDILDTIVLVGSLTDRVLEADALVASLRGRIERVAHGVVGATTRPRVVCLEWVDPLYRAGHWLPGMVSLAGGVEVLGHDGVPSTKATWQELIDADPAVILAAPCGFGADRAAAEVDALATRPGWQALQAVRNDAVWVGDGSAYFARPGPRMVDGLEMIAHAIHPEIFAAPDPRDLRRYGPTTVGTNRPS